ncbi:hypothetical protein [Burkholderia territorii]|uniref:DUF7249 family protein n=1 Tax=Burkholderia territorii TaxID=1503055 RepID=UPI000AB08FE5|nr:hypothetical protein [Burkholderia territorii]
MTYNGHKNYNYWNVSLWLNNDEQLYRRTVEAIRSLRDKDKATRYLLEQFPERTPDGVKYTFRNVREALKYFDEA